MKKDKVTLRYKYKADEIQVEKKSLTDAIQHADSKITLLEQGNYESGKGFIVVKIIC